jgi:hypothetical protein
MRTTIAVGFLSVLSTACIVGNGPEGQTDQSIKGRNKMFASSRAQNNVESFDWDGVEGAHLSGSGVTTPFGVHVDLDDIYVVSQGNKSVYVHRHVEGEAADRHKLSVIVASGAGGLTQPFYPTVRGDNLYVSSGATNQVLVYNKHTGASGGAFVAAGAGGVLQPRGIDFDSAGNLYVSSYNTSQVLKYDSTGAYVGVFASVPNPCGLSIDANGRVCVGSAPPAATGVHCFDAAGTKFYGTGSGAVCGLDWGRDGSIYITRTDPALGTNTRVEQHDFVNPGITFASVPLVAGVSWGNDVGTETTTVTP